ncbi:hypothetical protein NLG97_g5974 [Lecanicillium saksenae]|uniref:Uncharacterized protein n=1 Tax=Lecanicillium saksenae TaxID=468837 RepID=A0ACC1QTJ3_9HYPO|nr:hypothetical protein NLG97_g5974 [Lecanicillium saksenae]
MVAEPAGNARDGVWWFVAGNCQAKHKQQKKEEASSRYAKLLGQASLQRGLMAGSPEWGLETKRSIEAVEEAPNFSPSFDWAILLPTCLAAQPINAPLTLIHGGVAGSLSGLYRDLQAPTGVRSPYPAAKNSAISAGMGLLPVVRPLNVSLTLGLPPLKPTNSH